MFDLNGGENNLQIVEIKPKSIDEAVNVTVVPCNDDDPDDKKLLRKLDWHLLPTMTLLYLLSYLDRVNIGQAKLNGLTVSLNLTSAQYNTCLSVFFATYVTFEIPSNLILKKLRPSRWIPLIMVAWGIIATLMGLVNSYSGLVACRLMLGVAEAGFFPGATFYLSSWYKRRELSCRISFLFSAVALSGASGGILAYGINNMNGIGRQEGWRWVFYIEGIVTVAIGALAFFFLYDFPSNRPKFLTESECNRVITRLQIDAGPGASEHFSWKQVRAAFLDWKVYVWCFCFINISIPLLALSYFSPTIIQDLGFDSYKAQLLTAPPNALAFITTMSTAYFSDKYARRGIFILFWLIIAIIGYVILIVAQTLGVKYFAVFLLIGSLTPTIPTCITFISCNISPHTKRAVALAFMLSMSSIGGIISGQLYRTQDAPRFIFGHAINLGFCAIGFVIAVILLVGLHLENRRRDRLYGPATVMQTTHASMSVTQHDITNVFAMGSEQDRRRWGYENMSEEEIRDLGDRHAAWRYIL